MSSTKTSTRQSKKPVAGQFNLFGGVEGVEDLINPTPSIIESNGVRVVGVVIPLEKQDIPGYIPSALRKARNLVPEVQTKGKPPWLSAKWQAERRKRRAIK